MTTEDNNGIKRCAAEIIENQGRAEKHATARHSESKNARQSNEDAAKDRHRESEDAMVKRHRESEDTLRTKNRATEDAACERHRESNRRSIWMFWQNYAIIGLLLVMYLGGSENARLNNEGNRVAAEIKRLKIKNSWNSETRNALQGFVSGDTNILERVLTQNPHRNHDFPWADWNPAIAEKCVRMAIDANKMTPLIWMTHQPRWWAILSLDTVKEVKGVLNPEQKTRPRYSSNRSQSHWRRSIIAERDSLKSENASLKSELSAQASEHKNARLFMFSLFWDDPDDFKKVRLDDLPTHWAGEYQSVIERLKETGSTNVLPLLDSTERALRGEHPLGGSQ